MDARAGLTAFEELNGLDSECRSYLVVSGSEAVVVDPLLDRVEQYVARLRGLRLMLAIDTHTHADHLSGTRELVARCGGKTAGQPRQGVHLPLGEGDSLTVGSLRIDVWGSPGHTADTIVLVLPDRILSADTLFIGTTGRTDLPTGDAEKAWDSLARVMTLPDSTLVFPGHDYGKKSSSTIGDERRTNNRWLMGREKFIATMREPRTTKPRLLEQALAWNSRPL